MKRSGSKSFGFARFVNKAVPFFMMDFGVKYGHLGGVDERALLEGLKK